MSLVAQLVPVLLCIVFVATIYTQGRVAWGAGVSIALGVVAVLLTYAGTVITIVGVHLLRPGEAVSWVYLALPFVGWVVAAVYTCVVFALARRTSMRRALNEWDD